MESNPGQELITRASQGDRRALDELVVAHTPALLAYLRLHAGALIKERESCADLAQSVCREVLENAERFEFRGEAPFRKWLFQKAMSKIVDRQRFHLAERRSPVREERPVAAGSRDGLEELPDLLASFVTPSQVAIRNEDLDRLERAFAELPEEYRDLIVRARLYGESHAEIAADLGKSEGATRVMLHRALVRLGFLMSTDD